MDNPKAYVRSTKKYGKGVFAKAPIKKGEIIARFDGPTYQEWDYWTDYLFDHVIQYAPKRWRTSNGIAKLLNHSCDPNCGIKARFNVVAMRDIKKGEEITWDYEMTERSTHWHLKCKCGSPLCRKKIGNFRKMPKEVRQKYKGYISSWLLKV